MWTGFYYDLDIARWAGWSGLTTFDDYTIDGWRANGLNPEDPAILAVDLPNLVVIVSTTPPSLIMFIR